MKTRKILVWAVVDKDGDVLAASVDRSDCLHAAQRSLGDRVVPLIAAPRRRARGRVRDGK